MERTKEIWEMDDNDNKYAHYYTQPKYDTVERPEHYCSGGIECIDVMEMLFGTEAVMDFCRCNIFKYRFRAHKKNGEEDIKKAEWYERKLRALMTKVDVKEMKEF